MVRGQAPRIIIWYPNWKGFHYPPLVYALSSSVDLSPGNIHQYTSKFNPHPVVGCTGYRLMWLGLAMFFLLVVDFILAKNGGCFFYLGGGMSTKPHPLYDWSLFSYIMHSHREYKYNIYTNYKVHVLKQSNFPNQEERLSQLLLW